MMASLRSKFSSDNIDLGICDDGNAQYVNLFLFLTPNSLQSRMGRCHPILTVKSQCDWNCQILRNSACRTPRKATWNTSRRWEDDTCRQSSRFCIFEPGWPLQAELCRRPEQESEGGEGKASIECFKFCLKITSTLKTHYPCPLFVFFSQSTVNCLRWTGLHNWHQPCVDYLWLMRHKTPLCLNSYQAQPHRNASYEDTLLMRISLVVIHVDFVGSSDCDVVLLQAKPTCTSRIALHASNILCIFFDIKYF